MRNESMTCSSCRYHKRMTIRRNGERVKTWICDGDLSEYEGAETSYSDTCTAWESRED